MTAGGRTGERAPDRRRRDLALDLVSPLPPVRTGIADYTVDLLPELEPLCDLRVVRVEGQEVAHEIVERWHPVPMERLGEGGRVPFYQMGNNLHHERILESALERPGLLTLHDLFLHHLLVERTLARGEIEPYREWLTFDHGLEGAAVAEPPRWGAYGTACLFALPCHRRLAQSQRGILVHSQWARARLLEEMPDLAVRVVPMPMPLPPDVEPGRRAEAKQRLGIPETAHVLGSFGFQTPIKRTDVVIAAMARPELSSVHLLVVGAVARELDIESLAREHGVADRVHAVGFLDRDALDAAMAAADLCVNLRYPTAGETSASLLRLLAAGRPTLVSDYAQFTDLPRDCVAHVPVGEGEVEAIAATAGALLANRDALAALGRRAREHVRREHDPGRAAALIVEACDELARRPPGVARPALPGPPSALTWGVMGGALEVEGAATPWPEGERRTLRLRVRNDGRTRWLAGTSGPGGVAFEVRLWGGDRAGGAAEPRDEMAGRPWPALPVDLAPGEEATIELEVRRPLGTARLRIEPHVLGVAGAEALGGGIWEAEL
ncbi:MAG TPA: glycosyltransferase [Thermoanaerobaculia bacterium]|nr:glycosyltransferase [Thermoanaerobaculia bacterium]